MKLAIIVIIAYLMASVYYVWRDLTETNIGRTKPYAMRYRRTHDWVALLPYGIGWVVGVFANAKMRGRLSGYEVAPLAVFIGAAAVLWMIVR